MKSLFFWALIAGNISLGIVFIYHGFIKLPERKSFKLGDLFKGSSIQGKNSTQLFIEGGIALFAAFVIYSLFF